MGETIEQVKKQLNDFWQGMDQGKKKKFIISSILIVIGVTVLIFVLTRTKYEVLYDNLSSKDAGQVTKQLDEMNIKWKTGDKENTILVPADVKNKVKLELASEDLPKEGYGFADAFNDSTWTMTDYEKKERVKYALQNELASTISEIDGIESATVYIDEKGDTGFVLEEDKNETTASVFIRKEHNGNLPSDTITAIKNLVAGSINMDSDKVSIIDDSGRLLTENSDESSYFITDQYSMKQNIEIRTNESLRRFLENVFGYGNVDVRTSVKSDFDSEMPKIVEFSPPIEGNEEGLIRSMEEVEEHISGGGEGGVPGTDSNIPDYQMEEDENSRYDKASRVINNELNEINKEIRKAPGQIDTITVAVLINKDVLVDGEMTQDKKNEIRNLIIAATGLDTKEVEVSSQVFSTGVLPEEKEEKKSNIAMWLIIGALAASAITGFVIYKKRQEEEEVYEDLERTLADAIDEEPKIDEINFEAEKSEMKTQIEKFIEKKPDAVAQLLRSWLNE